MTEHDTSSIRESANEHIVALSEEAAECEDMDTLSPVGTYTKVFIDEHESVVNDANVEAFMLGAATANLLYQEALVRVMKAAEFMGEDADTEDSAAYAEGSEDACSAASEIAGENMPGIIRLVMERPLYERAFKDIISDM